MFRFFPSMKEKLLSALKSFLHYRSVTQYKRTGSVCNSCCFCSYSNHFVLFSVNENKAWAKFVSFKFVVEKKGLKYCRLVLVAVWSAITQSDHRNLSNASPVQSCSSLRAWCDASLPSYCRMAVTWYYCLSNAAGFFLPNWFMTSLFHLMAVGVVCGFETRNFVFS